MPDTEIVAAPTSVPPRGEVPTAAMAPTNVELAITTTTPPDDDATRHDGHRRDSPDARGRLRRATAAARHVSTAAGHDGDGRAGAAVRPTDRRPDDDDGSGNSGHGSSGHGSGSGSSSGNSGNGNNGSGNNGSGNSGHGSSGHGSGSGNSSNSGNEDD